MAKEFLKFFLAFFVFVFLISDVLAVDIAYVVKTPFPLNSDEITIKDILEDSGHGVVILDDDYPILISLYDIIIVGEDVTNIEDIFNNKNSKTLFLSYIAAKNAGLSKYSGTTTGKELIIKNVEHFIIEGIGTGTKTIYKEISTINYLHGCKAKNSTSLAYKSEDRKSSLLVLETDALLLNDGSCSRINVPINERNVFFGLPKSSKWNYNSKALFINSIDWLIHGSDDDGDGFYYEEDCNDNNASINPDAEEIPYNGIDEDCNGSDLEDVDEDGYKAEEVGGNDCDDEDETVNPGSTNVYKNCRNDKPIILEDIEKIIVYETEIVEIEVSAIDPENDALSYSINDSRFSQDENIFTWETDYNDSGDYVFTITVSDGNLSDKIEVEVEVKNTNRVPVCNEIPDLEWDEDKNASLDLKLYCSDDDGDALNYYVNDTSSDTYVIINSLQNGIVNFSSQKDWSGEDWIIFKVSDGEEYSLTNEIILRVLPENDAPILEQNIANITWNEDTNLTNHINLNNYFSDVDNGLLNFNVVGAHFVDVIINSNGSVSFYPQENWFGEENVVFSASDSEFLVYSNAIILKVLDMNEPPEFQEIECNKEILEDTAYECELNASDSENDTLTFSVVSESNLGCSIEGNNLEYVSKKDYNGNASCLLRVSDAYGYDNYLLEVEVEGVNDAPTIRVEPDTNYIKILEGTSELFKVFPSDVDGDVLYINWLINNEGVSSENSYLFNKSKGNYEVKVEVSDETEEVSYLWDVFVSSISDFTCQEVNGYLCKENEICLGNLLGVKDTNSCCSVSCSPKFRDIERCENLSEKIEIQIKEPNENEKFKIGETINIEAKIKNKADEDLDFDAEAYLYDITEDESVEEEEESVSVDEGDSETVEFEIKIPQDIDEKNEYAIFVKVIEDEYCNENYVKINIEREKHDVIVEDVKIEDGVCGDYIDVDVKIKNIGSKNEDVSIKIENPELNISEKSEEFEIEKYDEKDEETKSFKIKIPEDASAENYTIKTTVTFEDGEDSTEKELILGKCEKIAEEEKEKEFETKIISLVKEGAKEFKEEGITKKPKPLGIILLLFSMIIVIIAIIYLVYLILKE